MRNLLLNRVESFLEARGLRHPHALVVAAVSGGPDSLCLLHILAELSRAGGWSLPDYASLHRWSVEQPAQFWSSIWKFGEVRGE
ncbi:MAG: hypothetical protein HGA19_20850, partial [Oscillochloris sp.]|nr:hypothetical protein [Oscillochloris sp.]